MKVFLAEQVAVLNLRAEVEDQLAFDAALGPILRYQMKLKENHEEWSPTTWRRIALLHVEYRTDPTSVP